MLRIKLLLISLLTIISLAGLMAQVNVHGTVLDEGGLPQENVNIQVFAIFADSTIVFESVFTNPEGTYEVGFSGPLMNFIGFVQVSMVDCWGNIVSQEFTLLNGNEDIEADFTYCTEIVIDSCSVYILEEWVPGTLNALVAWVPANIPVDYLWSNGETGQTIYPKEPGTYCVTVTYPWGCTPSACYDYIIDSSGFCFSYIISTPNSDGTYNLEAIANGTAPFSYQWDNGLSTPFYNNVGPGTYCVTVTDANGCENATCIFVDDFSFCEVWIYENPNGVLYAESYGLAPFTYLWSTGDTTQSIVPNTTGLFCVTVTDQNQCTATSCYDNGFDNDSCYVFVKAFSTDSNTIGLLAVSSTFGDSVTYLWSTGETGEIIYPQDPSLIYCVTMTDSEGCVATGCYEPYNSCYTWVDLYYADTTTAILTVYTDPIYGWGGLTDGVFLWSTGDTTETITVTESGTYCVTVTLGPDCITEACTYVDFESLQYDCSAYVFQYPDSNGLWIAEVIAWGSGDFSYLWSTGDTSTTILLDSADQYVCATATSTFGCVSTACVDTFFNPCKAYISVSYTSDGIAFLEAYGFHDPGQMASYTWNTGETTSAITVNVEGSYCVTISGGGCISEACVDVLFWNFDSCGVWIAEEPAQSGILYTAEAWGEAPFVYAWSNGASEQSQIIDFGIHDLCITVTDASGCVATSCNFPGNNGEGNNIISGYVFADSLFSLRGIVYAYSIGHNGGTYELADSTHILNNFYKFNPLPAGLYILKAEILPGTVGYVDFMPTYHYASASWETADTYLLPNWLTVTTDIYMLRIDTSNGTGVIGGAISDPNQIMAGENEEVRGVAGIPGVNVFLRDVQGNPLNYKVTLQDGSFRFTGLPFGTYRISYDIPGLHSPDVWVTLTANDPEQLQVSLVITETTVDVEEPQQGQALELSPNPAKENITLKIPGDNSTYTIQIIDMQGRVVKAGSVRNQDGIMLIDVEHYVPGLYHINLKGENTYYFGRFVKQE